MTVLTMSASEVSRFDTLMRLDRGDIRPTDAMVLLKLGRSQLYRLLKRMQKDGAALCHVSEASRATVASVMLFVTRSSPLYGNAIPTSVPRWLANTYPSAMESQCRTRHCAKL